jgi:hypothetical protein
MNQLMPTDWQEMRRLSSERLRAEQEARLFEAVRENARLAQENEYLRSACGDLTASAERWIRLYERALARANAADQGRGAQAGTGERG